MRYIILCLAALLLFAPCASSRSSEHVQPPKGFRAYRATMYGNERTKRQRRISCGHTASGEHFCRSAHAFAMTHALGNKYAIWTPGHKVITAVCNDTGADHPDLAYGMFHELYYQLPSRSGRRGRITADNAGVMTIWMKRIGKVQFHHKHKD